jgi:hypothetical protein
MDGNSGPGKGPEGGTVKKFAWIGLVVLAVVFTVGMAFEDAPKIPSAVKGLLNGVLAGVMAAVLGWVKNRNAQTGDMEKLDIKYIVPTVAIGAIVGLVSTWMGKSPAGLVEALETSPIYAGIVVVAEMAWKAVWRNSVPMVKDALAAVKTGAGNPTPPAPPTQ